MDSATGTRASHLLGTFPDTGPGDRAVLRRATAPAQRPASRISTRMRSVAAAVVASYPWYEMRTTGLALATTLMFAGIAAASIGGRPLQQGASQGVRVHVFAPATAIFDLRRIERTPRRLVSGPHGLMYGCLKARLRRGIWHTSESMLYRSLKPRLRFASSRSGQAPHAAAPYDGCELGGLYGHRWNDAFGTRSAVEVWLTVRGRHFFNDRAAARDLAYFVRSRRVHQIRLSATPRVGLEWFVRRYPGRVVELARPSGRVPKDVVGFWIGPRTIVFTVTSSTKRRFFVVAKRASFKLPSKNLGDLAFAF